MSLTTKLMLVLALAAAACHPAGPTKFAELNYPWPVKRVDAGGHELAYVDVGQGPRTLVLLHGLGSYIPAWSQNIGPLASRYRVVALDLPGFGKSDKPDATYSMKFYARSIHSALETLAVTDPVLIGHSMGGQIAMTYALTYPKAYSALVLSSPAGLETFEDGEAKWLAQAVTPEFTCAATDEAIYTRHAQNFYEMPKSAHFMVQDRIAVRGTKEFPAYCEAVSKSVAGMLDGPVSERLEEIKKPVLVVFGKHDALIPNPFLHGGSTARLATREAKRFADAAVVILPKGGHMAQFELADAWNDAVLGFLGSLPVAAPPADAEPAQSDAPVTAPSDAEPDTPPQDDQAPPDVEADPEITVDEEPAP